MKNMKKKQFLAAIMAVAMASSLAVTSPRTSYAADSGTGDQLAEEQADVVRSDSSSAEDETISETQNNTESADSQELQTDTAPEGTDAGSNIAAASVDQNAVSATQSYFGADEERTGDDALMGATAGASAGPRSANEEKTYGNYKYKINSDSNSITITKYTGQEENVTIPEEIDGRPVIELGDNSFENCKSLSTIQFPDNLEVIGSFAFLGCNNLKDVQLLEGLKRIGYSAFTSPLITSITIPSTVKELGWAFQADPHSSFSSCSNLETVVFADGTTSIQGYALSGCKNVKNITIPESVTEIGDMAFLSCSSLKEITLPKGLKEIRMGTFARCDSLCKVQFPDSLETIDDYSFSDCTSIETVSIFSKVQHIGKKAFSGCKKLRSIRIPQSVTSIGEGVFDDCNKSILTIYGYKNSYAETFAKEQGIAFVSIDEESINRGEGFNLTRDGHCVINSKSGFGYDTFTNWFGIAGYKIPLERYQEVFGEKYTKQIYKQNIRPWKGNCFGMSATAALFYLKRLPVGDYTQGKTLNEGGYDKLSTGIGGTSAKLIKTSELTKLIERYQIWQESSEHLHSEMKFIYQSEAISRAKYFLRVISIVKNSKEPVLIAVEWNNHEGKYVAHEVVTDSSRAPEDMKNGWYRLYIYDPNNPYFGNFGKKKPAESYRQAKNRFIELNVNSGQWRMSAVVNGEGESIENIGYDQNGNLLANSHIYFERVGDFPTSFETKATFVSRDNNTIISYACNDFTIKNSKNQIIYQVKGGRIHYSDESVIGTYNDVGYCEDASNDLLSGKVILPKDEYKTDLKNGFLAYSSNGDYAGVVTGDNISVQNSKSTELKISSDSKTPVNIVIEDSTGDKFVSVQTDIAVDNKPSTVNIEDGKMTIDSDVNQQANIDIIDNEGEKSLSNVELKKIQKQKSL